MGESRGVYKVLMGRPAAVIWGIILRWIFRKWDGRAYTGMILLKIGTGGRHL
jgi:hypothetical protein